MAAGNKHLGYKEALNAIEATSPGHQARLLLRVPRPGVGAVHPGRRGRPGAAARVRAAAARPPPARCARSAASWSGPRPCPWSSAGRRRPMSRPFAPGEQVLLIDVKKRRYLLTLTAGEGVPLPLRRGRPRRGDRLVRGHRRSARRHGMMYTAIRPTLADFVLKMPRGAQVIYPKDLGPILLHADIFPGARVLESGVGSGALSMTLLRAGAEVVGLRAARGLRRPGRQERGRLPRRSGRPLPRGAPRLLRGHRRDRPRPHRARPPRAVAGGEARGAGAAPGRDPARVHASDHPGGAAAGDARRVGVRDGGDDRGAPTRVAHRGAVGAA